MTDGIHILGTKRRLAARGIHVHQRDLDKQSPADLFDAHAWAAARGYLKDAPRWLREWLDVGLARPKGGTCLICGCTERRACTDGCAWVDPSKTLCTRCEESVGP